MIFHVLFKFFLAFHDVVASTEFSPNVKYNTAMSAKYPGAKVSYINLKAMKDYHLDVTPNVTVTVKSPTECAKKSLKHHGMSINVEQLNQTNYNCEVLSTDYFHHKFKLNVKHGTTHYAIMVSS